MHRNATRIDKGQNIRLSWFGFTNKNFNIHMILSVVLCSNALTIDIHQQMIFNCLTYLIWTDGIASNNRRNARILWIRHRPNDLSIIKSNGHINNNNNTKTQTQAYALAFARKWLCVKCVCMCKWVCASVSVYTRNHWNRHLWDIWQLLVYGAHIIHDQQQLPLSRQPVLACVYVLLKCHMRMNWVYACITWRCACVPIVNHSERPTRNNINHAS